MWWRPESCGYTPRFSEAGRYSRVKALIILARANIGPELSEIAFPDPVLAFGRQTVGAVRDEPAAGAEINPAEGGA